jgi:hypothetical protein
LLKLQRSLAVMVEMESISNLQVRYPAMELGEPTASQNFLETMAVVAVAAQPRKRPPLDVQEEPEARVAVMVAAD